MAVVGGEAEAVAWVDLRAAQPDFSATSWRTPLRRPALSESAGPGGLGGWRAWGGGGVEQLHAEVERVAAGGGGQLIEEGLDDPCVGVVAGARNAPVRRMSGWAEV